ncbi:zinc finger, C2H2 type [Onchocerca flexuosa]|uniref:Zinc finger, C2H2 type n=1 Tax=Onchocerca flexuosa TaxID=387005 RepID=A0A238BX49_9BILA|nr:zinc finger, C2H2 type [Onchocerca flexuosa]
MMIFVEIVRVKGCTLATASFLHNLELSILRFADLGRMEFNRNVMKCPEIITLDNSDDDDSNANSSVSQYVGATASVIRAEPLTFSALQPKRSAVSKLLLRTTASLPSQISRVKVSETPAKQILRRTSLLVSHAKQPHLEFENRVMSHTENDITYITLKNDLSSSRRENSLDSYCYESYDPKAPPFEAQQFSAKFRCSVGNCRMLLSNNISFMFHLWAHLTEFSYGSGLNCPREMHRFCRCPQCLHLFPTAYRLQIHYDNVHSATPSSSTCKICEITVDEGKHRQIHGDFDAPFHCKKCRYRTSMRTHFIDHFVRFHSNTRTLLCPFCLCCYVIPKENTSSVIIEREYAKHFLLHQKGEIFQDYDQITVLTQLLPSLILCSRCKRASCIEREILDHVRDCNGGHCVVIDLKQEKSNIFSQYNDELEMKIFALRHQEEATRLDNGHVMPDLYNYCHLRDQNSLSPSFIKANMELNNARLNIL